MPADPSGYPDRSRDRLCVQRTCRADPVRDRGDRTPADPSGYPDRSRDRLCCTVASCRCRDAGARLSGLPRRASSPAVVPPGGAATRPWKGASASFFRSYASAPSDSIRTRLKPVRARPLKRPRTSFLGEPPGRTTAGLHALRGSPLKRAPVPNTTHPSSRAALHNGCGLPRNTVSRTIGFAADAEPIPSGIGETARRQIRRVTPIARAIGSAFG